MTTTIIRPQRAWQLLNPRELWTFRELLYFLVWRDIKVRYKQTAFGVLWAVLQPLALMTVFTVFLGRISGIGPPGIEYPLFAYAGLVPWTLFFQSVTAASESLVVNPDLVTKVYFPRLLAPLAAAASHLLDVAIASVLLVGLMLVYGVSVSLTLLWVPAFLLLAMVSALGAGIWLSALNVRYRDIRYAVPLCLQVGLFLSPVVYASSIVPERWRVLYALNPLVTAIDGIRWAALHLDPPTTGGTAVSVLVSVILLVWSLLYFRRVERTFADVI